MDPCLVVSPHYDDAVLSAGQFLHGWPGATVATVFTDTPSLTRMMTSYDKDCGFGSAASAMRERHAENERALVRVGAARGVSLGFLDNQYREVITGTVVDEGDLAAAVGQVFDRVGPVLFMGPLGLNHPDHHLTRRAVEYVAADNACPVWLYEDMPSRVWCPEMVPDAIAWWEGMGWSLTLDFPGTGDLDVKAKAIREYKSQLWALGVGQHACLVPERFWKAVPS